VLQWLTQWFPTFLGLQHSAENKYNLQHPIRRTHSNLFEGLMTV